MRRPMLTGPVKRSKAWFERESDSAYRYTHIQLDSPEPRLDSGSMYKQRIITGAICAVLVLIIIFVIVRKLT